MRKKKRYLYLFMIVCLLIAGPFIFNSLFLPGKNPGREFFLSVFPSVRCTSDENDRAEKMESKNEGETREVKKEEPEQKPPDSLPAMEQEESPPFLPSRGNGAQLTWDASLLEGISFLQSPLPGAKVSSRDSQLPGAPRSYRNGVHEGLDFYSGACGIDVNFGDPVFAAGPGVVHRIDHDYIEPPTDEREEQLKICAENKDTPEDILDKLRGRQVWLVHPCGVITRYAHLSETSAGIQQGDTVAAGDLIGSVGNSGTSEGAQGNTENAHLHFEIWIGGNYLGEGLSPGEIRDIWRLLLEK